jgi:hypothetical protein
MTLAEQLIPMLQKLDLELKQIYHILEETNVIADKCIDWKSNETATDNHLRTAGYR